MNRIREALSEGRPALGSWFGQPNSVGAEMYGKAGFDWVVLDTQHGAVTLDTLVGVLQALQLGDTAAVVRVGWNDPVMIMRALDLGALGVIVPMVSTAAEARAAAAATRYPPEGIRSFGPVRSAYGSTTAANDDVLCLVMIETAEGLANVEEIAATPGVDGLFIGPVDLGLSIGTGADFSGQAPALREAIDAIIAAAEKAGIIAGTLAFSPEQAEDLLERGIRFLTVGSDGAHIMAGTRRDTELIATLAQRFTRTPSTQA
jgi:4-hydroxy-2-oxoheptanedioate aldolase